MISTFALLLALATPTPVPGLPDLGEIGRVKSLSPACAVMRDLAIPAFGAALSGDKQMSIINPKLPQYARVLAEAKGQHSGRATDPFVSGPKEMLLSQIGQAATNMLQNTKIIADALGDPRIAATNPDPAVQAQRKALEALYDDQQFRATTIWKFQMRQQNDPANGLDVDPDTFKARGGAPPAPTPAPPRPTSTPLDMPRLLGNPMQDADAMRQWTSEVNSGIRGSEESAAKTLLPIAQACRGDATPAPK